MSEAQQFEGLLVIDHKAFKDERGFFKEIYNENALRKLFPNEKPNFVQDNESFSYAGVLRGLHFQRSPHAQGKLIHVIDGCVQDIIVDLRSNSKTFLKYFEIILTGNQLMYVPPGFAHGFLALEDTYFHYKCTEFYSPQAEGGLLWNDSELALPWKISDPKISLRDQKWPDLNHLLSSLSDPKYFLA